MSCKRGDVVTLGPMLSDGGRLGVRHTADHKIEVASVHKVEEGANLAGHRVLFGRTTGNELIVEDEMDLTGASPGHAGPARVTSDAYRDGWARIFGSPCDEMEEPS